MVSFFFKVCSLPDDKDHWRDDLLQQVPPPLGASGIHLSVHRQVVLAQNQLLLDQRVVQGVKRLEILFEEFSGLLFACLCDSILASSPVKKTKLYKSNLLAKVNRFFFL